MTKAAAKPAEDHADPYGLSSIFGTGKKAKETKHVPGHAEDLHQRDDTFAPKAEAPGGVLSGSIAMSDSERKAMEEDIARLKHQHDEAELRSQKRIVELLEQNSANQKALDERGREK